MLHSEVSNNGTTWTPVWDHSGSSLSDTSWQTLTYDISAIADGQATVYLRWVMGTTDSSVVYCGWNIDDVEIWADSFGNPCVHHGDCNLDGEITSGDAQMAFMCALGMIIPSFEEECAADCNADAEVTAGDAQQIFMTALGMTSCADPMTEARKKPAGQSQPEFLSNRDPVPVSLEIIDVDDEIIEIAIKLLADHAELDAFWIELALDARFKLVDCYPGDLSPDWIQFGCHDPEADRIRIGAYNDGMNDPVIPSGVEGILATVVITGPVNAVLENNLPVSILKLGDDLID